MIRALLIACVAVLCSAEPVLTCTGPIESAPAWQAMVGAAEGGVRISGAAGPGWAGCSAPAELSAHAERTPILRLAVGGRNAAKRVLLHLLDQDGHDCSWVFDLPGPGTSAEVPAAAWASFTLPNRPDPRDGAINDLRRITAWRITTEPGSGILDVRIEAVLAGDPDAAGIAARAALAEQRRKEQGWAAAREKLSAQFQAAFPELSTPHPQAPAGRRLVRALHIGNSLTFQALSTTWTQWSLLGYEQRTIDVMEARGVRYIPAWHISWGASLPSIWSNAFSPAVANAGPVGRVLDSNWFDVITLQLWGGDAQGDVAAATAMIAKAAARNPDIRPFLVETWVKREKTLDPPFLAQWERPWVVGQRGGIPPVHCRAYARQVFADLQAANPGLRHPVRLIPIGSVLAELDRRFRAGAYPGLARVEELYADEVHLNQRGNYAAWETFYAVIIGDSPIGKTRLERFPGVDDAFAGLVQDVVQQVVAQEAGRIGPGK
ncbi:MAG: hypothetical protein J0M02_12650 [Planctomycetes bacterium]|nr:hypothetical protein [Planctomycetota bacterium]